MPDLIVKRTLVKSPPELWSELSEVDSLARHLDRFGEIKIRRLEPERRVAWEGENARGSVEIEASAWGTKVTMRAELQASPVEPAVVVEHEVVVQPDQSASEDPPADGEPPAPRAPRGNFLTRWLFRARRAEPEPIAEPVAVAVAVEPGPVVEPDPSTEPETEPEPAVTDAALAADEARAILEDALESLGSAHHRPFSRG
jgi:hypothetical protein